VVAIELSHVTKEYHLGGLRKINHLTGSLFSRSSGNHAPRHAVLKALDNVDLTVNKGEVLGIIGQNGAGKSTLLKLIARIIVPTSGQVKVHGSVAPLMEIGGGFAQEFTGRENILLTGAVLGMQRRAIARKFDDIVAFSELEGFIDEPIKHYSTGMTMRLAFSIATAADAEILVIDEVLAVGDLTFQRKCIDRMENIIKRQGRTVVLVSHNIRHIERLCNRALLLDRGRSVAQGDSAEVCELFNEMNDETLRAAALEQAKSSAERRSPPEIELIEVMLVGSDKRPVEQIFYMSDFTVLMRFRSITELADLTFGLGLHTADFVDLATHNSERQLRIAKLAPGDHEIRCKVRRVPLVPGVYSLRIGVTAGSSARPVFYSENVTKLQIVAPARREIPSWMREGFIALDASWEGLGEPVVNQRDTDRDSVDSPNSRVDTSDIRTVAKGSVR